MVLVIHGDFWKILVVEVYISIDQKGLTLGILSFMFFKEFALKGNLFYSIKIVLY